MPIPSVNICPFAEWRPGPWEHSYGIEANEDLAVCLHSMEGPYSAALNEMDNFSKGWHFSVTKDGRTIQHYPLRSAAWHSGNEYQSRRLIGIEHEGVVGEPLTIAQQEASLKLVNWIAEVCGWPVSITDGPNRRTVYFHSDATATTCPNGRIDLNLYSPVMVPEPPPPPPPSVPVEQIRLVLAQAQESINAALLLLG
jgi:hypothetical protein